MRVSVEQIADFKTLSGIWKWLRGRDLNPRPSGYEPDELPGCSTPRLGFVKVNEIGGIARLFGKKIRFF